MLLPPSSVLFIVCMVTTMVIGANAPIATVLNGSYAGLHLPTYSQDVFLGMPYAQDTGGSNRFRPPQTLHDTWDDMRPAVNYSAACPDYFLDGLNYGLSENCLTINVVRPAGLAHDEILPVVFWIHGGSYQTGSSSEDMYNLTHIVSRSMELQKPIIAASINYRKGGWGNMYSAEIQESGNTNLALRDMIKALQWVSENIAAFHGNPDQVTLWGESSGAFAVGQLLMAYGGKKLDGLFHQTIAESGSASSTSYNGTDWHQPIYNRIVDAVGCGRSDDTLDCLRSVPYDTLYPHLDFSTLPGPGWYPTVDGDVIPDFPTKLLKEGRFAKLPQLNGVTSDEGTSISALPALLDTDDQLRDYLIHRTGFGYPENVITKIVELYLSTPALGVPINTGNETFPEAKFGLQYKRIAAIVGDVYYHAPHRNDVAVFSETSPTWSFRFNTRAWNPAGDALLPAYLGVGHAAELTFVFNNPEYLGPWPEYSALGKEMSQRWINFIWTGDPNSPGVSDWPLYDASGKGSNLVIQTCEQGGSFVEEDTYRGDGMRYLTENAHYRRV